jgi:RNA polymerase sigma factor (TIGR02999 family)
MAHEGEITRLLDDARAGKADAQEKLFGRVYAELQKIARAKLSGSEPLTLLDAPALVHEAYLRVTRLEKIPPGNSKMFYGYAASVMRSVIIDYVRERNAAKRGDGIRPVTLVTSSAPLDGLRDPDVEKLEDALQDLERIDKRCLQVVEMRYFAGMSLEEIADATDVSLATVKRDWQKARAFLLHSLQDT